MKATSAELAALTDLQEADRLLLRATHELEGLPQIAAAEQAKAKLAQLEEGRGKIEQMLADAEQQMERRSIEDDQLANKQVETQVAIDSSKGDYRRVTALTRDLEGMAKRRETLAFEMSKDDARITEVKAVLAKANAAIEQMQERERKLRDSYEAESEKLHAQMDEARAARDEAAKKVGAPLMKEYGRAVRRCGGVGVARLSGETCSACRSKIEPNKLLQVMRDAPVAVCPSCRRLLIVEPSAAGE